MKKHYILFIDSGTGGLSTLAEIYKMIPANFIYFADNKNCPYGSRTKKELLFILKSIIDEMLEKYDVKMVVLACNTATTSSIDKLRSIYKNIDFVGIEPAIRLASKMGFNRILTLSTPVTAHQSKYLKLKHNLPNKITSLCMPDFAYNIEFFLTHKNYFTKKSKCRNSSAYLNPDDIFSCKNNQPLEFSENFLSRIKLIKNLYTISAKSNTYDCIVLGCTHYCLIQENISIATKKPLISGNFGVAKQIIKHLNDKNLSFTKKSIIFKLSDYSKTTKQNYIKIFNQILAN